MPLLKEGAKGEAVSYVQEVVETEPVDGNFGQITKKCIMEYQRAKGIEVDGIVGAQTWTAIITT